MPSPETGALTVTCRTPLRISLAGGGTDLPGYYETHGGAVVSMTIARHIRVDVRRARRGEDGGAGVRDGQIAGTVEESRLRIVRACLEWSGLEPPIEVHVGGDRPAMAGLGGSSALAVGVLHAVQVLKGESPTAECLAAAASEVEIEGLGEPIGKQDQYAAAYGGLNMLRFSAAGVEVAPLRVPAGRADAVVDHLLLLWTGLDRRAATILAELQESLPTRRSRLDRMRAFADDLAGLLRAEELDPVALGGIVQESWELKQTLSTGVSNPAIDEWLLRGRRAGAYGGKVCGAGGGGCLLFVVSPDRRGAVRQALGELTEVPLSYEPRGSIVTA